MVVTAEMLLSRLELPTHRLPAWRSLTVTELTDESGAHTPLRPGFVRVVISADLPQPSKTWVSVPHGRPGVDGAVLVVIHADETCENGASSMSDSGATFMVDPADLPRLELTARAILDQDAAAEARRVLDDVRRLSHIATTGDTNHVVGDLSKLINGWAVVVDATGEVVASAGAGRVHLDDARAAVSGRPVRIRDSNVQVHPLGQSARAPGYLVVSGRLRSISRVRALAEHAASLLNLTLHAHDHSASERRARAIFTEVLREPTPVTSVELFERVGFKGTEVQAFRVSTLAPALDIESMVSRWLQQLRAPLLYRSDRSNTAGFLPPPAVSGFLDLLKGASENADVAFTAGISNVQALSNASRAWSEAALAHDTNSGKTGRVRHYADLTTAQVLRASIADDIRDRFVDILQPVRDQPNGEQLLSELYFFLRTNGNLGESAEQAGIHRHTMRAHIRLIERVCGLSFSSIEDRSIGWLALIEQPPLRD